ncbi:hypothetical protein [Rhizobium herbae]
MTTNETPTGLAPSADSRAETRRKVLAGKGVVLTISAIAVGAFIIYAFIMIYGIMSAH